MTATPDALAARANEKIRGWFPALVGLEFLELSPDRVLTRLAVRDELKQPWGVLHGGAMATLLDTTAAAGAVANLRRGERSLTRALPHSAAIRLISSRVPRAGGASW